MTDLKTISQIADDIGVTRQAVYSKLKYAELSKAVTPYIVKRGTRTLYNIEAQNLIKQAFSISNVNVMSNDCQDDASELTKQHEYLTILSNCQKELDKALNDIVTKNAELSEKELIVKRLTEQLTILQNENKSLYDKISDKDNTIKKLEADKEKLNERLDKAEADRTELITNNKELTIALKAAQALHGMDKQQAVIEVDSQEQQVVPTFSEPETTQPIKKTSLFARLFKRN